LVHLYFSRIAAGIYLRSHPCDFTSTISHIRSPTYNLPSTISFLRSRFYDLVFTISSLRLTFTISSLRLAFTISSLRLAFTISSLQSRLYSSPLQSRLYNPSFLRSRSYGSSSLRSRLYNLVFTTSSLRPPSTTPCFRLRTLDLPPTTYDPAPSISHLRTASGFVLHLTSDTTYRTRYFECAILKLSLPERLLLQDLRRL
jgi:hypothetical protein